MSKPISTTTEGQIQERPLTCGIIMPISALDGCPAEHWLDVKEIITESMEGISSPKFSAKLVSEADNIGVIQKRIIQNIYESDIVICDVSGKNPNVMFELGMRLAFDKATIIIKDDKTEYSFDTSIIEHITYPRDLRFQKIVEFKENLRLKALSTHNHMKENPDNSIFLKNFGKFNVAKIDETTSTVDQFIISSISELQSELSKIRASIDRSTTSFIRAGGEAKLVGIEKIKDEIRGAKPEILDDNEEFMLFARAIEGKIGAHRYFSNSREFREELRRAISESIRSKS